MKLPIQITARGIIELTDNLRGRIEERAYKLDRFYDRITGCHVTVDVENRGRHRGLRYILTIVLTVPGKEIVVNRGPAENLLVAIRDAFNAAGRRLEDHARVIRGDVKSHGGIPMARVSELHPRRGYGYLETTDGRLIYFHRNSVRHDAFRKLRIGTQVHFAEEIGDKGPQASTVTLIR